MKTWITYLASLFLGLATALLLGDSAWSLPAFGTLYSLAVNTGALLALAMVVVSTTSAIASLRKDALRSSTIFPDFVGHTIAVHDGRKRKRVIRLCLLGIRQRLAADHIR